MGCDIHYIIERKFKGGWLGASANNTFNKNVRADDRNYHFFGELASVRVTSSIGRYPKFIPDDISDLSLFYIAQYGSDGHSHSYISLKEFVDIYNDVNKESQEKPLSCYDMFQWKPYNEEDMGDYRIIFFFDN